MNIERALLVEDDDALRAAMARVLSPDVAEIFEAGTLAEARRLLDETDPDLVLLDVRLPDGSGIELAAQAADRRPKPTVIAMTGEATAGEAFALGHVGVAGFLDKPFTPGELRATIERGRRWVPRIEPLAAQSVGKRELLDLVASVRRTMVDEALAQAAGSRRGAAKALGVSRQAIQQIVRKRGDDGPSSSSSAPLDEA